MDQVYAGPYGAACAVLCQKKLVRTYESKSDEEVFVELSRRLASTTARKRTPTSTTGSWPRWPCATPNSRG